MKKFLTLAICVFLMSSGATASFACQNDSIRTVKTTDMPDYPDDSNDGGPFIEPSPTPDPGPDSTDSGDSWDSDSSGGGFDGGGYGDVLF